MVTKAFVFDFDDTLATTTAKIHIYTLPDRLLVGKVSPQQFSSYKLKEGEVFDFSEFRQDKFIHAAEPTFLIGLAKEVYREGHHIFILTAREDDSTDAISAFLERYEIKAKTIYCVGGKNSIAEKKREMLLNIMCSYDKVYYYDDNVDNIRLAPSGTNIRKYQI